MPSWEWARTQRCTSRITTRACSSCGPAYNVSEGAGTAQVSVVRSDDGTLPITVDLATSDLTATNGVDYAGTNTTLAFAPAEQYKLVAVPIINNHLKQPGRAFRVNLSNPVGASLGSQSYATLRLPITIRAFSSIRQLHGERRCREC